MEEYSESQAIKDRAKNLRVVDATHGAAAGLSAVVKSLKMTANEMGIVGGAKALLKLNQPRGFDCPGCAWPDPQDRHTAEFCENGAKAVMHEGTKHRADAAFFAAHSVESLRRCTDYELEQFGRLCEPMVLRPGATHYTPIPWAEAFDLVAETLCDCASPDEAIFYTS